MGRDLERATGAAMNQTSPAESWHCVMLHAAGSSPRALQKLRVCLECSGMLVAAPQLPMRVMPGGGAGHMPFAGHVSLTEAALGQDGRARRVLFGHSFGGLVALLALMDGVQVDAAILYEPIVLSVLDSCDAADRAARLWDRSLVEHLARSIADGDPEAGVSRFIEAYNEVRWPELPERARAGIVSEAAAMGSLAHAAHHLELDADKLAAIGTSVLVMTGSRTLDVTRRMVQRLARLLPRASLVQVEGGGHMAPILLPEPIAAQMDRFLNSI